MPIKNRPDAKMTSPRAISAGLNQLKKTVEKVETRRGTVNVAKLEKAVMNSGDVVARRALGIIKDEYGRTVRRYVSSCGGSRTRVSHQEDPKTLKAAEVKSVIEALIDAKKKVKDFDVDGDGKITRDEYDDISGCGSDLATRLVDRAVEGKISEYEDLLDEWHDRLIDTHDSIDERVDLDAEISSVASFHAKAKSGAEALEWAFRDLATADDPEAVSEMDDVLTRAETTGRSPLVRMLSGDVRPNGSRKRGHLGNAEIKLLLGVTNLAVYSRNKRAEIAERVGGDYKSYYLAGKDLLGVDDVDFDDLGSHGSSSYRSGC